MGVVLIGGLVHLDAVHGAGQAVGEEVLVPYVIDIGPEIVLIPALGLEELQHLFQVIQIVQGLAGIIQVILDGATATAGAGAAGAASAAGVAAAGGKGEYHHKRKQKRK